MGLFLKSFWDLNREPNQFASKQTDRQKTETHFPGMLYEFSRLNFFNELILQIPFRKIAVVTYIQKRNCKYPTHPSLLVIFVSREKEIIYRNNQNGKATFTLFGCNVKTH